VEQRTNSYKSQLPLLEFGAHRLPSLRHFHFVTQGLLPLGVAPGWASLCPCDEALESLDLEDHIY